MSKGVWLIPLFILSFGAGWCSYAQSPEADELPQTADEQFQEAYRLLSQADQARDAQHYSMAIELYRQALDRYIDLAATYPDWQPGVIRFRLSYCENQLKALLKNVEEGTIVLRMTPGTPAAGAPQEPQATRDDAREESLRRATESLVAGRTDEARQILLETLRASPDNIAVRLLIGVAQCVARRFDDAVFLLENLVEETPGIADAHVILGTAYFGLNREQDAVAQLQMALDINPSHKEAHFDLAQILLASKPPDEEKAGEHYRKALSLGATADLEMDQVLIDPDQ